MSRMSSSTRPTNSSFFRLMSAGFAATAPNARASISSSVTPSMCTSMRSADSANFLGNSAMRRPLTSELNGTHSVTRARSRSFCAVSNGATAG